MVDCTVPLSQLMTGLAKGQFEEMGVADALGYGGASDTTLIWKPEVDIHVLFDPQNPAEGFQVIDYSARFEGEPNMCKCWQVAFTGEVTEIF